MHYNLQLKRALTKDTETNMGMIQNNTFKKNTQPQTPTKSTRK